ncbi:hypothetical protein [Tissierella praeacuta]|uniref:hypothetical protein n=1 Tax=Tissierella praeacuta TaxID=43131 RepID=UPI00333E9283
MFNKIKEILNKKELDEDKKDVELERGDFIAMAIALSYYIVPAFIGIFAIVALIIWILFY